MRIDMGCCSGGEKNDVAATRKSVIIGRPELAARVATSRMLGSEESMYKAAIEKKNSLEPKTRVFV